MLRIILLPIKKELTFIEDGRKTKIYPTFTRENDDFKQLAECHGFPPISDIEIVVVRRFWRRRLTIHPAVRKGIIEYLTRYHDAPDMSFDCYAFVNLSYDMPRERAHRLHDFWETTPLKGRMRPGDVVFLVDRKKGHFHAALHLDRGYYVSVYGAGGEMEISTLEDMQQGFQTNEVLIGTPKLARR